MIKPLEGTVKPQQLPTISPSAINLFIKEPALWVLKYFYGKSSDKNIHAMRGIAIEDGINRFIETGEDPTHVAIDRFTEMSFFWSDYDLIEDIEEKIPQWVSNSMDSIPPLSSIIGVQKELVGSYRGVPLRGFVDYATQDKYIDLKTVTKLPKISSRGARKGMLEAGRKANIRQQTIYNIISDKPTALLYVTPCPEEKFYLHDITQEEMDEAIVDIDTALDEIKNILTMNIEEVMMCTVPNWKSMKYSFYWDEPLRDLARVLWRDYVE